MYVPPDNEPEMRRALQNDGQGTCGPAAVAALTNKTVRQVIEDWPGEYRGWGAWRDIKKLLEEYGYSVKARGAKKCYNFPLINTDMAILRIQWLKDDGTEYYWAEASRHTHFVAMKKDSGKLWVFCNSRLWFDAYSLIGCDYLENGYVTSYYELIKEN